MRALWDSEKQIEHALLFLIEGVSVPSAPNVASFWSMVCRSAIKRPMACSRNASAWSVIWLIKMCVADGRRFIYPICSDGSGTALSGRPYFSKQRSQYPVSGCLEQRKCTRVLQASQSLKSRSRVPAISIINCSPSLDSDSWTVKPPCTGLLHTEQTSFKAFCMVLQNSHPPAIAISG